MNARVLTNDYRDFQLLELGQLTGNREGRGPYMWVQDGIAPHDPQARNCSFVLTRRGTWLHYYLFLALPESVRRHCAQFDSSATAMTCAAALTGTPEIEDALTLPELIHQAGFTPAETDQTGRALWNDLRRRHPQAPVTPPNP